MKGLRKMTKDNRDRSLPPVERQIIIKCNHRLKLALRRCLPNSVLFSSTAFSYPIRA